ncbi:hypothetical protein C8R45DRAFT_1218352 [Mycena sanguinolenta]|nr:hypothetical protein C8R45DRAFT_1218352 [Mycena sanguinolenta]
MLDSPACLQVGLLVPLERVLVFDDGASDMGAFAVVFRRSQLHPARHPDIPPLSTSITVVPPRGFSSPLSLPSSTSGSGSSGSAASTAPANCAQGSANEGSRDSSRLCPPSSLLLYVSSLLLRDAMTQQAMYLSRFTISPGRSPGPRSTPPARQPSAPLSTSMSGITVIPPHSLSSSTSGSGCNCGCPIGHVFGRYFATRNCRLTGAGGFGHCTVETSRHVYCIPGYVHPVYVILLHSNLFAYSSLPISVFTTLQNLAGRSSVLEHLLIRRDPTFVRLVSETSLH